MIIDYWGCSKYNDTIRIQISPNVHFSLQTKMLQITLSVTNCCNADLRRSKNRLSKPTEHGGPCGVTAATH